MVKKQKLSHEMKTCDSFFFCVLTFPAILIYIDYKSIYAPMQIQES